jgi:hypothetical protein
MAAAPQEETLVQHTSRGCMNFFTGCFGEIQKSDEFAKIKYKETQIAGRKKAFGVEYLDLLAAEATPEALAECTKKAQDDMKKIMDEIEELQKDIERVDAHTKTKIVGKPDTAAASATTEETKTDAPAAPAATPAAISPAATTPVPETPAAPVAPAAPAPGTENLLRQ